MSDIAANSKPAQAPVQVPYGFTEVINVAWASAVGLEADLNAESSLWSQTVQEYLEHADTTMVWWGRQRDSSNVLKLIVGMFPTLDSTNISINTDSTDWKPSGEHDESHSVQSTTSVLSTLEASQTPTSIQSIERYAFTKTQGYHQNAFQAPDKYFKGAVTVFTTFYFPSDWISDETDQRDLMKRPKKAVWDNAWSVFQQAALRSEGAWIADKSLDGWSAGTLSNEYADPSVDQKSFIGVFRFQDARTARKFAVSLGDPEQEKAVDGFVELREIAEWGMNVELVDMTRTS